MRLIMIKVQETTKSFEDKHKHIYFLSDDKFTMFGYIPYNETESKMVKIPLKFNPRGRTFSKLKA